MQTILGAGGAIGRELGKSLKDYTDDIRLVSRNPSKINEADSLMAADLTDRSQVESAIEGSEIVYLTVGLPYNLKVWRNTWPVIMGNVIHGCKLHGAKLVFLDNIYMYPRDSVGHITERNPIEPQTKKGLVRAQIFQMLMDAVDQGHIEALVARAADFYGPGIEGVSVLTESVFRPLSEGKKASLIGGADFVHSFTYTPDAGKATALLGNTADAFGEVWHLPTAGNPWTMRQWIERFAIEIGAEPKFQVAGRALTTVIGLFVPIMKELSEMIYQYNQDYNFISEKFEQKFDFTPTSYEEGLQKIIEQDYSK